MDDDNSSAISGSATVEKATSLILIVQYVFLVVYFGVLWATTPPQESVETARQIADDVFAQFLGYFLTVILGSFLFSQERHPNRSNRLVTLLLMIPLGAFGLFVLNDFTDSLLTAGLWIIAIITGLLRYGEDGLTEAVIFGGWLMVAGFISALIGSMAGGDSDALLSTSLAGVAGWGMLYYAGASVIQFLMLIGKAPNWD